MNKKGWQMSYTTKYFLVILQFINFMIFTSNIEDKGIVIILKTFSAILFLGIHTLLAKHSDFFKEGIL